VHDELAELVKAGLTPAEALRAATASAAEFLGREDDLGSVAEGKLADLVLLEGDPLEDIDNVRKIRAVVFRGELLDRNELDGMLAGVEEAAQRPLGPEGS
jgi:imidazolonepropionase-like amidohydrolase